MASLWAAQSSQLIQRLRRPSTRPQIPSYITNLKLRTRVSQSPLSSRLKNAMNLQIRERLFVPNASNQSSMGSNKDKSEGMASGAAQGPPLLTIVAGLLVLFITIWVFGSIIMWLFGLIVNGPPSK